MMNFSRSKYLKKCFSTSTKEILSIKTKYLDNYNQVADLICNNYKMLNSSQIFHNEQSNLFEGYIEVENLLNKEFTTEKLNSIVNNFREDKDIIQISLSSTKKEEMDKSLNTYKKFSVFNNNKKVNGVVTIRLFYSNFSGDNADLNHTNVLVNNDYGVLIEKVI